MCWYNFILFKQLDKGKPGVKLHSAPQAAMVVVAPSSCNTWVTTVVGGQRAGDQVCGQREKCLHMGLTEFAPPE